MKKFAARMFALFLRSSHPPLCKGRYRWGCFLFPIIFPFLLPLLAAPSHAAEKKKEAVVLMPMRATKDIPQDEMTQYETALVKSLSGKYVVYSGQRVMEKVSEVYKKRSGEAKAGQQCDETKCLQDVAIAFQTELVAVANIRKSVGGYSISLTINDVTEDKSVFSEQKSCKGCDEFGVLGLLQTLTRGGRASQPAVLAKEDEAGNGARSGGALEFVIVDSEPEGAKAELVDGKGKTVSTAVTPGILKCTTGKYEVRISLDGYRAKRFSVEVTPGSRAEIGKTEASLVRMMGSIVVDTAPYMKDVAVYVDGKRVGAALSDISVPVGKHEVEARGGNKSGKKTVSVKEGEQLSVSIEFPAARKVASSPDEPSNFTDDGEGAVTDGKTGLMWQQQDDDKTRTWDDAMSYCQGLSLGGHSDWRLPSKDELASIIKKGNNPTIDTASFPNTKSSNYWSSTTYAGITAVAWYVNFNDGFVSNVIKTFTYYARCVRLGR